MGFAANARTLYEYAGNNPLTFIDQCGLDKHKPRPPRCLDIFWNCLRDWMLPGSSTVAEAAGLAAANARALQVHNQALQHAAARGLRYAFKSSIFRPLIANSRWRAGPGTAVVSRALLDFGIGKCPSEEVSAAINGQCRP
jgi:hypothetical protein